MTINLEKNNDALTLKLEGRLDTTTAPELEKVLKEQLVGIRDLIFDMTNLEYISSAGLRVLLAAQKEMDKAGAMRLKGVCDSVMEVFEITGFADILTID